MEKEIRLHNIHEWEKARNNGADYHHMRLRQGMVLKVTGTYKSRNCVWDWSGLAYHQNGKRFKGADMVFRSSDTLVSINDRRSWQ